MVEIYNLCFYMSMILVLTFYFICSFLWSKADLRLWLLPAHRQATTKGNRAAVGNEGHLNGLHNLTCSITFPTVLSFFLQFHVTLTSPTASEGKSLEDERPGQFCDAAFNMIYPKQMVTCLWKHTLWPPNFTFLTARQLPHTSGHHAWTVGCSSPRCWPPRGEPAIFDQN